MIRSTAKKCNVCVGLAFIFDVDGVILDSNRVHAACWREYLRRCGCLVPEDFEQRMFGRRNDDIVRDAFGSDLDPAVVFRHGADKEKLFREVMGPVLEEHLVPGIGAFLERHQTTPMAVATNAEPANADLAVDGGKLRHYFRAVIDGHQVERPKPDPEIYLLAARRLAVEPRNCIIFEDSVAGVEAARAAGARVVALTTTHSTDELPPVELSIRDFLDPGLEPWLLTQNPV